MHLRICIYALTRNTTSLHVTLPPQLAPVRHITEHQLTCRFAFTGIGPYPHSPHLHKGTQHKGSQGTSLHSLPIPTSSGTGTGTGTGTSSTIPGATPVSPHPAPSFIRTRSSTSRQNHITTHSAELRLSNDLAHSRDPSPDAPGEDLVSPYQLSAQPLRLETGGPTPTIQDPPKVSTQPNDQTDENQTKMIFTDLYKSPRSPLSRLRHAHQPLGSLLAPGGADYDADLISKDKTRQKSAVKRHLAAHVRNDWTFTWPPENPTSPDVTTGQDIEVSHEIASRNPATSHQALEGDETALDSGEEPDSESEADSVYSTISEDPLQWKTRLEWTSELSDDELPFSSPSPYKFDTPDSVGQAVSASKIARKARRRRELRKEIAWNDGLACFEARRNAWTGAKVARVRPKQASAASPSQRKGYFWRTHTNPPTSPTQTSPLSPSNSQPEDSDNFTANNSLSPKISRSSSQKQPDVLPVETLLPIPAPLLPPANPMRLSIQPQLYNSIYEKVVVHSLQPSCPINLADMIRACVSGWKRDGEWPPRTMAPEPAAALVAVRRKKSSATNKSAILSSSAATATHTAPPRKMSFSFLGGGHGGEKDKTRRESEGSGGSATGKAIRRSLQKVLGIGHNPTMANGGEGNAIANEH